MVAEITDLNEAAGCSNLDLHLLKITVKVICQSVSTMFNLSFSSAGLPRNKEIISEIPL